MTSVGAQLRQARGERKLSLSDVSRLTKIQPWVLEALESDRLADQMSPVYVKGFLTTYARYLHMAHEPLLAQLVWPQAADEQSVAPVPAKQLAAPKFAAAPVKAAVTAAPKPVPAAAVAVVAPVAAPKPAPAPKPARAPKPKVARPPLVITLPSINVAAAAAAVRRAVSAVRLPQIQLPKVQVPQIRLPAIHVPLPVLRRAGGLAVAGLAVWGLVLVNPLRFLPKLTWSRSEPSVKTASIAKIKDAANTNPATPTLTLLTSQPLELAMTANHTTWVQVKADGKLLTQQRLQRGSNEKWVAKKQLELVVAKPSQVDLRLNGQSISTQVIAHDGRLLITHRGVTKLPTTD